MTVTRRIRRRGEHAISRKTIARGMPVDPSEPVVTTLVCFVLFRTRGCGCSGHPAFPAPSIFLGEWLCKNSGASRRGIAGAYLKLERRHCERSEAHSSCPALCRAFTSCLRLSRKDVDGRDPATPRLRRAFQC